MSKTIYDIPAKQDVEEMTNPLTQVSAEEFNAIVDNAKENTGSIAVMDIELEGLANASIEDHKANFPLTLTVAGIRNPYEQGVTRAIALQMAAMHKGEVVTHNVTYRANGEVVSNPHTVVADQSMVLTLEAEYTGHSFLGKQLDLTATIEAHIVFVEPLWIGGNSFASMHGISFAESGLTKFVQQSPAGEYGITLAEDGFLWFCMPTDTDISKATMYGFDMPLEMSIEEVELGVVYRCYRCANELVAGNYSVKLL